MNFKEFTDQLASFGLSAIDHGDGHWTINGGKNTVHWWPESKRSTVHIEGTKWTCRNGNLEKIIRATELNVPRHLILPKAVKNGIYATQRELNCPECGSRMILKQSNRFGLFYGCSRFPECDATHGSHPDGRPLGKPADSETKQWRIKAHQVFDTKWHGAPGRTRKQAYRWLASQLGIEAKECHIGMFDREMCEKVIQVCQRSDSNDF